MLLARSLQKRKPSMFSGTQIQGYSNFSHTVPSAYTINDLRKQVQKRSNAVHQFGYRQTMNVVAFVSMKLFSTQNQIRNNITHGKQKFNTAKILFSLLFENFHSNIMHNSAELYNTTVLLGPLGIMSLSLQLLMMDLSMQKLLVNNPLCSPEH